MRLMLKCVNLQHTFVSAITYDRDNVALLNFIQKQHR